MPWNSGGPSPWGNPARVPGGSREPSGSGGKAARRRRRPPDRAATAAVDRGGGGGPGGPSAAAAARRRRSFGGGGPMPDIDRLIAQAAGLHPRPAGRRLAAAVERSVGGFAGGRGLAPARLAVVVALARQRLLPRAAGRAGRRAALRRL